MTTLLFVLAVLNILCSVSFVWLAIWLRKGAVDRATRSFVEGGVSMLASLRQFAVAEENKPVMEWLDNVISRETVAAHDLANSLREDD